MPFSLDTSGILDAWVRYYPRDVFPTIWSNMDSSAKNGDIFVIDEVLRELERKDDDVYKWVKTRGHMIVLIDQDVQTQAAGIMKDFPRLIDTRRNRSGCDPWVIALAVARQLTVVTGEKPSGNIQKPKIPDVCQHLNVPCIGIVDFFRAQGWRL